MSSIPEGGEGLFARKDLEADLVVCFYNGIRIQVHIDFVLEDYLSSLCMSVCLTERI